MGIALFDIKRVLSFFAEEGRNLNPRTPCCEPDPKRLSAPWEGRGLVICRQKWTRGGRGFSSKWTSFQCGLCNRDEGIYAQSTKFP